ncbi:hypothetical protein BPAE_0072g00480 [Botrytis paeoniae]|uniref:Uncharacterized protein n=1 Tax=Botrytis paeoniae TaxID=278948 RepID=A0A4Z1FVQ0_9HELO|nr:hypothetical protein BPAE_0072g00480 [Botrytis paeoniae]
MALVKETPGTTSVADHDNPLFRLKQAWYICKTEGCRLTKYSQEEQDGKATNADSNSDAEMSNIFTGFDIEITVDDDFSESPGPINGQEVFSQHNLTEKGIFGIHINTKCSKEYIVGLGDYEL